MRTLPSLLFVSLLLAGCGGGGSQPGGGTAAPAAKGTATVSVAWPARSGARFVPVSSNSVVVTLSLNGVQAAQQTVPRPADGATTSTAGFTGLVYGTYTVNIDAKPNADGTGTAQAKGATSMVVTEDAPGVASVSLATTVANLTILPLTFSKNQTAVATVGATDANGATVLLAVGDATETITWSADKVANTLGAMVDAVTLSAQTGTSVTLTGVHSGTTQVHATPGLGLATPLVGSATVTVNAIADGTGTVTVS